jgi:hypothetical protein
MSRYYFDVRDGIPIINDRIGIDLPDLPTAIEEAHREAALVASAMRSQPCTAPCRIRIGGADCSAPP